MCKNMFLFEDNRVNSYQMTTKNKAEYGQLISLGVSNLQWPNTITGVLFV